MEEFSFHVRPFPEFTTPSPSFLSEEPHATHLRRSFSEGGPFIAAAAFKGGPTAFSPTLSDCATAVVAADGFLEYEERMDMLWEDFNEELYRFSLERELQGNVPRRWSVGFDLVATEMLAKKEDRKEAELHWLPESAAGLSKRSEHRHKRPGLVVMLKVLKKLFLVHRTESAKRRAKQ